MDEKKPKRIKLYALILMTGIVLGLVMGAVVKYQKKRMVQNRINDLQSNTVVTTNN